MPTVSTYSPTGDPYIDGILSSMKWGVTSLTFSFPTSASYYGSGYAWGEPASGFEAFTATQQTAARSILQMYSSVTNLTFTEVTETSSQHGDLRYAESDMPSTAWAYYPSVGSEGGDAWFNNSKNWYDNPVKGNYAWLTMIHETGHALGLKHPQDSLGAFGTMPLDHDSLEYTVMSYRSFVGAALGGYTNAADSYPQTLMMYDIAALQLLYGADYTTNAGDTVYSWSATTGQQSINGVSQGTLAGNKIFMTLWDGGGHDTYNFSNYTSNLTVNLQPGAWTIVSSTQLANLGGGHTAVGNIANALLYNNNPASLIEDAIGGSGNDAIVGNNADNHLTGGAGNDALDGGNGSDTAVFSGLLVNYQLVENANGTWTITDLRGGSPDGVDTLSNIEQVQFSDQLVSLDGVANPPANPVPTIASYSNDSGTAGDGITSDNTLTFTGTAGANSTVKVYDGATLLGTAAADGNGAWSFTTAVLTDGAHSFTATATDGQGNTSAASTPTPIIVDTVAPGTPTLAGFSPDSNVAGDGLTNANTLTLVGTAEAGSTVKVYDGATLLGTATAGANGAWSFTTFNPSSVQVAFEEPGGAAHGDDLAQGNGAPQNGDGITGVLSDGAHQFTAAAVDAAGNTSAASSVLDVTIDTAAPLAPTIASFSNDSGAAGDGVTNDNTLTLAGSAEAGSTVKVYDGATLLGSAVANGSGAWSYTTAALTNGGHSLTAKASDTAGNTGVASTALNVTVDTAAPAKPVIASFSTDSGTTGDGITNDNTLTLAGTAEAGSTVKVYDGATLLGSAVANGSGAWSYTTAALTNGGHSLTVTASDAAGNTGVASTALNVTVDTAGPAAPVISGDTVNENNTVTLTGVVEANATVSVYDGATLLGTAAVNANGTWTYTTDTLQNGAHVFTATATDAAGNTSAPSQPVDPVIDTVAPSAPTIASFSNDSGAAGDGITNDNTLTLTGTAEAGSTVKVYDGATLLGSAVANGSGAWSYTTAALANGGHSLMVTATDAAGNAGVTSAMLSATIDTTAPEGPNIVSLSPNSGNTLTLTGTAEVDSAINVYDGATLLGSAMADASGVWSYITGALGDGSHMFTVTATDAADNTSTATAAAVKVANGATTIQSKTWNPDGTIHDIHYYGITGQAYTDYDVVYGANNKPVSASYSNGMTATWTYNSDGTLQELVYNGITGQKYTSTDTLYGSNGKAISMVWSNDATTIQSKTWNPDGTIHDIHYYGITGQAYTEYDVVYGANNKPVIASYSNGMTATWTYNSDGTLQELVYNGITGQKYTSTDTLYGSNGKAISMVWSDDATTIRSEIWNPDGTIHDIHYYGITGQAYTEYDVVYGANNKPVSASYSNGMTATWTYNSDGTLQELVYNGITGQKYTSTDTLYGSNGKAISMVWSDDATTIRSEIWNPDGTIHDIHYYGITGQAYTEYDVVYGANNKPVSASYSNGMTATWTYNSDGTLQELVYNGITGQKYTSTDTLYGSNGKAISMVWSDDATTIRSKTWNPDGTIHDIHYYGITGQAYTEYDVVYGANNKPVSASYSNGMTATWTYNSDGTLQEFAHNGITGKAYASDHYVYDAGGLLISLTQYYADGTTYYSPGGNDDGSTVAERMIYYSFTRNADGSTTADNFDTLGQLTRETITYADHSRDVFTFGIVGKSYHAAHAAYNSTGALVEVDYDNNDGSRSVFAKVAGLTLQSSSANEIFTSYGESDTFAFKSGFGNDVINNFKSGNQVGHDTIAIDSGLAHELSQLLLTQVGHDVVVTIDMHDTITVKNVQVVELQHDFAFV